MTVRIEKPAINVREELADLRKPSGLAGEAMLRAETPQEQFNLIGAGRRNLIINGAMQVAQRGTSQTSQNERGYLCDRFEQTLNSYGFWTREQSTDAPDGFANSFKLTCTTADTSPGSTDYTRVVYKTEGQDLQLLSYGTSNAKDVTVSFWVKSNVSATYVFWMYQTDSPATRQINKLYTIDAVDTWEYKTITIEGDTLGNIANDTGAGMVMGWILSSGSGYTSGTRPSTWTDHTTADRWVGLTADVGGAVNNYFQITGVQLEVGKVATPFEHRSYGEELALCQRYYQRWDGTGPNQMVSKGVMYASTAAITFLDFKTTMRTGPTATASSTPIEVVQGGAVLAGTGVSFANGTPWGIEAQITVSGGTVGHGAVARLESGGYLAVDAEL